MFALKFDYNWWRMSWDMSCNVRKKREGVVGTILTLLSLKGCHFKTKWHTVLPVISAPGAFEIEIRRGYFYPVVSTPSSTMIAMFSASFISDIITISFFFCRSTIKYCKHIFFIVFYINLLQWVINILEIKCFHRKKLPFS